MLKFNQLINDKLNFSHLSTIFLFTFLPISLILGNAAINLNILLIDILFIFYCFKIKNWSWLKSKTFVLLSVIYVFLITNSFYSYYFLIENEIDGLKRSLLFIKFILLVFAFSKLLNDEYVLNTVKKNWLIISLIVIFDIFYEKYFGKNLLGYVSPNGTRIISFFKDEMVVGGFILCFGFTSITYFLNKNFDKKTTLIYLLIFLLVPIAIFLTGERANFIKSALLFFTLIFFLKKDKFFFKIRYIISLFIIIISCFIYFNENTKIRYSLFFDRIKIVENKTSILNTFQNIKYFAHFDTALKIFKNYPITGVGNKNFRKECSKKVYFDKKIIFSIQRCSTHPHQIHFEILSEQGALGFALIMYFIIIFLLKNIKIFIKCKNINYLNNITYIFLFFLPLLPGAGIFGTFNGALFWIIFSLTYLNYKNESLKLAN
jgi:O-antigen ligase